MSGGRLDCYEMIQAYDRQQRVENHWEEEIEGGHAVGAHGGAFVAVFDRLYDRWFLVDRETGQRDPLGADVGRRDLGMLLFFLEKKAGTI